MVLDFQKLDEEIAKGADSFRIYIDELEAKNPSLFQTRFYNKDLKKDISLLRYLIKKHDLPDNDLSLAIQHILPKTHYEVDKPIHYAYAKGKLDLVPGLLAHYFEEGSNKELLNASDSKGYTLLTRALNSNSIDSLNLLLRYQPLVNTAGKYTLPGVKKGEVLKFYESPLHHAVRINFAEGVGALMKAKAQIGSAFGEKQQTPFMLAVELRHVDSLKKLLNNPQAAEEINKKNHEGKTPIEVFCSNFQKTKSPDLLHGIAMLICHGSDAPTNPVFRRLLSEHRHQLMDEIASYAGSDFTLMNHFVRQVQVQGSPWHAMMYPKNWGTSFRHFVGAPDTIHLKIADLVWAGSQDGLSEDIDTSANFTKEEVDFARFVRLYHEDKKSACVSNRWCDMHFRMAEGEVTSWLGVKDYATMEGNETKRSTSVYNQMTNDKSVDHGALDHSFK